MIAYMSRYPIHTVTLPVLIDAESPEVAEGEATDFPGAKRLRFTKVRAITTAEVKRRLLEIFASKEISRINEKFLYVGAGLLSQAYDARDEWGLEDALKSVRPWIPRFGFGPETVNPNANKWEGARWGYSSLMSNAVQKARLVAWWPYKPERLLSPAVYCPDLKTAAFVLMFMGGVRVCPKCRVSFIPSRDNQGYCKPTHGVAYRTARSRWRAKQRVIRKQRKRVLPLL
jgi:hypothetical protein